MFFNHKLYHNALFALGESHAASTCTSFLIQFMHLLKLSTFSSLVEKPAYCGKSDSLKVLKSPANASQSPVMGLSP